MNELHLRDLKFRVRSANLKRTHAGTWHLEIDTDFEEWDGERWSPSLYHQGLKLPATCALELDGLTTSWSSPDSPDYPHPELGVLYVFGHERVKQSQLSFRYVNDKSVEVRWIGCADVCWDEPFTENVPFSCACTARTSDA